VVKLFLSTPSHHGDYSIEYTGFVRRLIATLDAVDIKVMAHESSGESHIDRGRDAQAHCFLKSDATHMLTFDADQYAEDPTFIACMLAADLPIVGAPVPVKRIDWSAVHAAARAGVPPEKLAEYAGRFAVHLFPGEPLRWAADCAIEVPAVGTGCMLIRRDTLEQLCDAYPDEWGISQIETIRGEPVHHLFWSGIGKERIDRPHLSEDYGLCERWRAIGGKVYLYLGMREDREDGTTALTHVPRIVHIGRHRFEGNALRWIESSLEVG
jgi:hypothetical protein